MIIFNKTSRVISFEKISLLPGSNKVETDWDKEHPTIKAMIAGGILELVEDAKMTADKAIEAINQAMTISKVNEISTAFKSSKKVLEAAKARTLELERINEAAKAATKKETAEDDD